MPEIVIRSAVIFSCGKDKDVPRGTSCR